MKVEGDKPSSLSILRNVLHVLLAIYNIKHQSTLSRFVGYVFAINFAVRKVDDTTWTT